MHILVLIALALPAAIALAGILAHAGPSLAAIRAHDERGSIATFIPEFWSRQLLSSLKKNLVFASAQVSNRNWEGEIANAGDTVHINSVGRPTIKDYTPGSTTITPEALTTAERTLVVDQSKYFAFTIDDVDARQAAGEVMNEGMQEASYALSDVADQHMESTIRSAVPSDHDLGTISVASGSPAEFYDSILIPLKVALDEADVPTEGRWVVVPAWGHGRLLRDDRFVSFGTQSNQATLTNGMVGRAAGFTILMSNNVPNVTGDDYPVLSGHPMGPSYAEQINKTEAYRPQDAFEDAVKGLHVYGGKVVRPEAVAMATASQS